jgi:6-phosphofructokinase
VLEGERHAALELAAASKAEVVQLQEAQRRLQWQSQLLEKMSEVRQACGSRCVVVLTLLVEHAICSTGALCDGAICCRGT